MECAECGKEIDERKWLEKCKVEKPDMEKFVECMAKEKEFSKDYIQTAVEKW